MNQSLPALLVEFPPWRRPEREYALSVLLGEWLNIAYATRVVEGLDETRIRLMDGSDETTVVIPDVLLGRTVAWLEQTTLPQSPIPVVRPPEWCGFRDSIPLLYPAAAAPEAVCREGSRLVLTWDLLGSLVFLLARYEEFVPPLLVDEHGRFPAQRSVLAESGWLQWPVADMYLHVFAAVLRLAWPRLKSRPAPSEPIHVGHDVDHPSSPLRWGGAQRIRVLAGDLARRRDPGMAVGRARSFLAGEQRLSTSDPFNTYAFLMQASEGVGVPSTFFFLTQDTAVPDGSEYRLHDAWAARLIRSIAARGHQVALHGSYLSPTDADRLANEWRTLQDACQTIPSCPLRPAVRQHYLRWTPGVTWRAQADAGLHIDETIGFAGSIGFRAGTARPYGAFDLPSRRRLDLQVRPLHLMDATLTHYLSLTPSQAMASARDLRDRVRAFGGALSVLWHNSSLESVRARRFYVELLRELA